MKILIITQRKLLPMRDGALIYSMGLIKMLHKMNASITLVSFTDNGGYTEAEECELRKYVDSLYLCPLFWKNTALNLSLKYPNNVRKYTRKRMRIMIEDIASGATFDTVIIDHLQMYEYAKLFGRGEKIVLHTHNVESNIWFEYAKKCSGIKKYLVERSAKMTYEYEKNAVNSADVITAISESDASEFSKMAPVRKCYILKGYSEYPLIKTEEDIRDISHKLLFIGSYGWYPNEEAALFLINQLMPKLRQLRKKYKLLLVGKDPTNEMIMAASGKEDIEITGMVESVDPYIKECDVFVNAVHTGSGINIKMAEALGKGIPVVSSVFGARGYDVTNGQECLLYDTLDECVSSIESITTNSERAIKMSKKAREFYILFNNPKKETIEIFENN